MKIRVSVWRDDDGAVTLTVPASVDGRALRTAEEAQEAVRALLEGAVKLAERHGLPAPVTLLSDGDWQRFTDALEDTS